MEQLICVVEDKGGVDEDDKPVCEKQAKVKKTESPGAGAMNQEVDSRDKQQ